MRFAIAFTLALSVPALADKTPPAKPPTKTTPKPPDTAKKPDPPKSDTTKKPLGGDEVGLKPSGNGSGSAKKPTNQLGGDEVGKAPKRP